MTTRQLPIAEAHPRVTVRPSGRREVALLAALLAAYSLVRAAAATDSAAAGRRADALLALEDRLGLSMERSVNAVVSEHALLAVPFSYAYAGLHYVVTPAVLLLLWRRGASAYVPARRSLVLMSALGLALFVALPTSPPRLLPDAGFVDTLAAWSAWGWWGDAASAPRGLGGLTNQYAAFPSLHVGWAVWCSLHWAATHRTHGHHAAAVAYSALIVLTVVATGNHYVLDAVAGIALALGAHAAVTWPSSSPVLPASEGLSCGRPQAR